MRAGIGLNKRKMHSRCLILKRMYGFHEATRFVNIYANISFSVRNFPHELVVYVSRGNIECKSDVRKKPEL